MRNPGSRKKTAKRRSAWWTEERLILGLQRFHKDFGFCPSNTHEYSKLQQFTGRDLHGKRSNLGWHQKYPSGATVLKHWPTFRDAWTAAGFDVDQGFMPWSEDEDWFVLESVGILPRAEVSQLLKRSVAAIKRRLYDLGDIRANNRWGLSISGAAHLMGISETVLRKYIRSGTMPIFKGHKLIYINPADLLNVVEVDWTGNVDPELHRLIKDALIQRILKILKFGGFRDHECYKIEKDETYKAGRIKNDRKRTLPKDVPVPPNDLKVGDWVKTIARTDFGIAERIGVLKAVHYSPQRSDRRDGTKRACWVGRIEFPRLRHSEVSNDKRIHYTLPLDNLARTEKPTIKEKPLSMHPEAIRGRIRFTTAMQHARERGKEILKELS